MLKDTKNIHIEPNVHLDKPVIVEGPNPPPVILWQHTQTAILKLFQTRILITKNYYP